MSRLHFVVIAILSVIAASAAVANTSATTVAAAEPEAATAAPVPAEAPPEAASTPEEAAKPVVVAEPSPTLIVRIDLAKQTMSVSANGVPQYTWPISSGTASHPTPRGTFRPQWTAKMWYSRKYDLAPMPHAVFINGGVAVHGTGHVGALGRPASHGCIRLAPSNARTFYNLVHRHGLKMTKVSVYGTPKWREPAVASRKIKNRYVSNAPWFWGGGWNDSSSAYDPGFVNKKNRRKYAVPPSKFYGNKKNAARAKPKGNGSSWNW